MALSRIVLLYFESEYVSNFKDHFKKHKTRLLALEGCLDVKLYQDPENPADFITFSIWEDDKSLQEYRKSQLFREIWEKIKPRFRKTPEAYSIPQQ